MFKYEIENLVIEMDRPIKLGEHMDLSIVLQEFNIDCREDSEQLQLNYQLIEKLKGIPVINASFKSYNSLNNKEMLWPIINNNL